MPHRRTKYANLTKKQKVKILEDYIGFNMKFGEVCEKYDMIASTLQRIIDEYWGNYDKLKRNER